MIVANVTDKDVKEAKEDMIKAYNSLLRTKNLN